MITPRYFIDPERLNLTPNNRGSKNPWSFRFLVKTMNPVLLGLTDSPTSMHHISMVRRAQSISPDTVFGNLYLFIYCNWVVTRWQWLYYM